jgi:PTS system ascorbate-specific IIA component
MRLTTLSADSIVIAAEVEDWRGAVRTAGSALANSGSTLPAYGEEMVRMIEEHGPYVVIAPGLALAHARPDPTVLANGLAVVTLQSPVRFGHPHNDPVSVVLGLAVADAETHLATVAELANVFNDESAIPALAAAQSVDDVLRIMGVTS